MAIISRGKARCLHTPFYLNIRQKRLFTLPANWEPFKNSETANGGYLIFSG